MVSESLVHTGKSSKPARYFDGHEDARRALRMLAASGVFVLVLGALWKARPVERNLALSAKASSSSQAFGTTAHGAVDGLRHGQLGFHSNQEQGPWLMVDLGAATALGHIEVYGRGDCCYDQSLPLVLDVSADGVRFVEVARRQSPFGQVDPWRVEGEGRMARQVRVRSDKFGYLVIAELEVFGNGK